MTITGQPYLYGAANPVTMDAALVDGFEVAAEVLGEIIVVVGEGVDACCQRGCGAADDVEGGLAGSGFISTQLRDVDAGGASECLLGGPGSARWLCGC